MSHYYTREGEAAHFQTTKTGGSRPTTVRDARSQKLLPSVTTVLDIIRKPGLEEWKINQAILSARTLPQKNGESETDFVRRIKTDMNAESSGAKKRGSDIHKWIEDFLMGGDSDGVHDRPVRHLNQFSGSWGHVLPQPDPSIGLADFLASFDEVHVEQSIVCEQYAGKYDMVGKANGDWYLVDFKTQNVKEYFRFYDEWCWQLAAYANGFSQPLGNLRCMSVAISTNPDIKAFKTKVWSFKEITEGLKVFLAALEIWKVQKGYYP